MQNSNYASQQIGRVTWAVVHKETKEVLQKHENLKYLTNEYKGGDYIFKRVAA